MHFMDELTYHSKLLRDLACLMGDDLFLDTSHFKQMVSKAYVAELVRDFKPVLDILIQNPEALELHMQNCPDYILGKYAEELMLFFIENHPRLELKLHNFQIIEDGITQSEIDFIFLDLQTGLTHHWELSYKFYLKWKHSWIGPNARDTLAKKLEVVETKQLPVARHSSVLEQVSKTPESCLYLKAYLFEEFDVSHKNTGSIWLRESELDLFEGRQHFWCVLPKAHWFSPACLTPNELKVVRWPEIVKACRTLIKTHDKSVMIARLDKQDGLFYENQRVFVVNENWPELNSQ